MKIPVMIELFHKVRAAVRLAAGRSADDQKEVHSIAMVPYTREARQDDSECGNLLQSPRAKRDRFDQLCD